MKTDALAQTPVRESSKLQSKTQTPLFSREQLKAGENSLEKKMGRQLFLNMCNPLAEMSTEFQIHQENIRFGVEKSQERSPLLKGFVLDAQKSVSYAFQSPAGKIFF